LYTSSRLDLKQGLQLWVPAVDLLLHSDLSVVAEQNWSIDLVDPTFASLDVPAQSDEIIPKGGDDPIALERLVGS
jgi:hypothetical protein